jgi:hypothetical protein
VHVAEFLDFIDVVFVSVYCEGCGLDVIFVGGGSVSVAAFEFVDCEWGGDWYFAEAAEFCADVVFVVFEGHAGFGEDPYGHLLAHVAGD